MKQRTKYTEGPIGRVRLVKDFLPPPEQLVLKDAGIKVTIVLSKTSVEFFKKAARKSGAPYQAMIRNLLDAYAALYSRR